MKIITFDEWAVAIFNVLELDSNYLLLDDYVDGKKQEVSISEFFDECLKHEGWQPAIMKTGDFFTGTYLFKNGLDFTEEDIETTRQYIVDYFQSFVRDAIQARYEFK